MWDRGGFGPGVFQCLFDASRRTHPIPTDTHSHTGISWFGCEGRGYIFTGLNYTSMDTILNFFVQHKFNTVRIPVSVAFSLAPKDTKPNPKFVSKVSGIDRNRTDVSTTMAFYPIPETDHQHAHIDLKHRTCGP